MIAQMFQRTPTMAIASAVSLYPSYPMVVSSFNYEGDDESEDPFEFSIGSELLLDPNDVVTGDLIGEGGYSMVYNGLYKNEVPVAVKILQPSKTAAVSKHQKEKFQEEVLLLSKINDKNIVKFYGACIEPQLMIVTELVEGGTLQKLLWDCRPRLLNLKMSLNFALDISRAMEYLHSVGIIHRDLKPKNILVTGDLIHAKLTDFGVAREENADYMTCEAGTYRWMAPEAFSREPLKKGEKKPYDHKIDVYSFAIVLWELLTNKQPFSGMEHFLVPYFVSQNERPSLRGVPDEAVPILKSCWAEDPDARPEFKEITVLLNNFLRSLCSDGSCAATTLSDEADLDEADLDRTTFIVHEECSCDPVRRPKDKKKKKKVMKKVANMIRPVFKMFRACLYKP